MKNHILSFSVLLAWVGAPAQTLAAQGSGAVTDSDLIVAHLSYHDDSAHVRQLLGNPVKRDSIKWSYQGMTVFFDTGKVTEFDITSPRYATHRGVRVGDSIDRVTQLYAESCMVGYYVYCRHDPNNDL